ncbi:MAG: hypothetical protein JJ971_00010 [Balneolaceae bacterium]|nr:hypothetical protein [Balneolaceae bacterium]MBO6544754.1 hypothetical protein [Balneolaceae bacterium]MBO6646150.1 hypothetical protein [Balneolaceae bacterium]
MTAEKINSKIEITWKAVELFETKGKVSIPDLVDATGMTATEIYSFFSNKKAILSFYYPALVYQYWAMIEEIDGFEDYSLSEKLSNFIYTLFDMMSENKEFVTETFDKHVFHKGSSSEFHKEVTSLFKDFLTSDGEIAVSAGFFMKDYFYSLLTSQYLFLINFWRKDESDGKERTLALSDKLTSLLEEAVYNKTLDKTFDLAKYVFGSVGVGKDIPFIGDCLTDLFSEKEEVKKDDNDE